VVMAADHPGSTLAEVILGDRAAEGINRSFATRPLEVLRQIAFAEALNEAGQPLAGLIDLDRIAVAGHSFGGYTAAGVGGARLDFGALADWCDDPTGLAFDPEADPPFSPFDLPDTPEGCGFEAYADDIAAARGLTSTPDGLWPATTDPRIGAVILLAPFGAANYGPAGIASIEAPTLIVVGSLDRATVPERDAYVYYDGISSAEKALVVLENAGHYIFLEECPPLAVSFGLYNLCSDLVWDMDRAHDLVNHFTTAFLLATFTGNGEAAALAPANVDFVGVQYVAER